MNDLMTVDPDGRIRAVFPYPQPPEPPDYSAEGLMDIVVDFDPFYEENHVRGHSPYLQCHNIVAPHTDILDTKLHLVDESQYDDDYFRSQYLTCETRCKWKNIDGELCSSPKYKRHICWDSNCVDYEPVDRGDGGGEK